MPPGVFNLVNGDGAHTSATRSPRIRDVDMVSFTGSTRAGVAVAKAAADTVKRVAQELGGKSANILLPDVDFERAVTLGVNRCFNNSGQSCVSPTRMLVPRDAARRSGGDRGASAAERREVGLPVGRERGAGAGRAPRRSSRRCSA